MKSTFFKSLTTLFILILTVSCSVDSEENIEQITIEQLNLSNGPGPICADPSIFVTDGEFNFYYIYVEYEPSSTKFERGAIRAPYCDRMVSITPCTTNPNVEIWHVKGECPAIDDCKPDIIKPTDPNLRNATFANTCISAPL